MLYIVLTPVTAYAGGMLAYLLTLRVGWEETIGAELGFVMFWGAAVYSVMVPVYFVLMYVLARRSRRRLLARSLTFGFLVSLVPGLLLFLPFGPEAMLSAESALVAVAFCTAGLLFGLCSWAYWTYLNRNVGQTREGV